MLAAVLAGIGVLSLQPSSVILHVTQHYEAFAINLADRVMSFGNATMSLIDPSRNIQVDELKLEELAGSLGIGATTYALSNVCEVKEDSKSDIDEIGEIDEGFEDKLHSTHSSACVDRQVQPISLENPSDVSAAKCRHTKFNEICEDFDMDGRLLLVRCNRCGLLMRTYQPSTHVVCGWLWLRWFPA